MPRKLKCCMDQPCVSNRKSGLVLHWDGDELLIRLPQTDALAAYIVRKDPRLRQGFSSNS